MIKERRKHLFAAVFALVLVNPLARAQTDEAAVRTALDRVVTLARGGHDDALAGRLACYTGVPGPGTLHVRPCVVPADSARAEAVATHLRATYGTDTPYVIDWLRAADADGVTGYQIQVKVRSTAPPDLVVYRFLAHGDSLLLADAGPVRLTPPTVPPPTSPQEAVERTMQTLFYLSGRGDSTAAALHVACPDAAQRAIHRCDYADTDDRARADRFLERIGAFLRRVGATGWGFTGYHTKDEREGTWHVLAIGYLDDDAPNGQGTAYAAFIRTGDGFALGDLAAWPE